MKKWRELAVKRISCEEHHLLREFTAENCRVRELHGIGIICEESYLPLSAKRINWKKVICQENYSLFGLSAHLHNPAGR